jgi:hypothetical protein
VHEDITIANVQSHMHRRGVGYSAAVTGQAAFYENTRWEGVPVKRFDGGLHVAAGSTLDYWCDYESHETRDVYQGPRTTDEMCMLIGSYYPADPRTSACTDESSGLGGEWVGNGTATCAATFACFQTAFGASDFIRAITDCVDAASPAVAGTSSAVLRCFANAEDPESECQAQIAACNAS